MGVFQATNVSLVAAVFYAPIPKGMTSEIDATGPNTSPTCHKKKRVTYTFFFQLVFFS